MMEQSVRERAVNSVSSQFNNPASFYVDIGRRWSTQSVTETIGSMFIVLREFNLTSIGVLQKHGSGTDCLGSGQLPSSASSNIGLSTADSNSLCQDVDRGVARWGSGSSDPQPRPGRFTRFVQIQWYIGGGVDNAFVGTFGYSQFGCSEFSRFSQ